MVISRMQIKTFYDTTHARIRRAERSLSVQAMKDVVNYSDKRMQQYRGTNGGFVYRFSKTAGGKAIVVIAEVKGDKCWLISGWKK